MIQRLFRNWKWKRLARQLRRPSGNAGKETGLLMNESNRFMYAFTLEQSGLKKGDRVLEIGFGNGQFFRQVIAAADSISLSGIDHSPLMFGEAVKSHIDLIQSGQLQLIHGNSNAMPWPDQHFDLIFCINVIYFWDNPHEHLREIRRVLKPGGLFLATCRSKENMVQMPFTKWNFKPYTAEEWNQILQQNGLQPCIDKQATEPGLLAANVPFLPLQWCVGARRMD